LKRYAFLPADLTFEQIERELGYSQEEVIEILNELADKGLALVDNITELGFTSLLPADRAAHEELKRVSAQTSLALTAFTISGKVANA
jgi:hypothetical protein